MSKLPIITLSFSFAEVLAILIVEGYKQGRITKELYDKMKDSITNKEYTCDMASVTDFGMKVDIYHKRAKP